MRTWNKLFWLCLTGTILLAAAAIFLPRYFSRGLDMGKLNRIELATREDFSFLEQGSNDVPENARALQYLNSSENELILIASYDETARVNSELLKSVYDQALLAANLGMIPWIGTDGYEFASIAGGNMRPYKDYWPENVRFARHYSLTYESNTGSNTKEMMNFWYLRFSDGKSYDYYFLVNALTYQIYYARIYNQFTNFAVDYAEQASESIVSSIYKEKVAGSETSDSASAAKAVVDMDHLPYMESFAYGSMDYYGANDCRYVNGLSLNNKLGLATLSFDKNAVYIEQIALPENVIHYRGIGVGFQNLGASIQELLQ